MIFVQSTEMEEEFSAAYTKIMKLGNKRIIANQTQRNVFPFFSLYHICASDVKSAHTHCFHQCCFITIL